MLRGRSWRRRVKQGKRRVINIGVREEREKDVSGNEREKCKKRVKVDQERRMKTNENGHISEKK